MSAPAVPDGQAPPFAVVTPTDHSAWIIIASAFGLSCVLLFGIIRVGIRLTIAPPFGLDDVLFGTATLIAIVQSSTILYAASLGMGKSIELVNPEALVKIQKLFYASTILFLVGLGLSKCSVVALLMRMTLKKRHLRMFNGALIVLAAWTIASTLASALQCNLRHPWILVGERCPGSFVRWQVFGSSDAITELALVSLAVYLVWGLRLSKTSKAIVIIAFSLRIPILILIAFRLHTFDEEGLTINPTLLETVFVVWTQAELDFSIVAATLPALRRFISGLATYYGALDQNKVNDGSSYQVRSDSKFPMYPAPTKKDSSATAGQTDGSGTPSDPSQNSVIANDAVRQVVSHWNTLVPGNEGSSATHVLGHDSNSVLSNESERQMIIRKDVSWTVEHGPN